MLGNFLLQRFFIDYRGHRSAFWARVLDRSSFFSHLVGTSYAYFCLMGLLDDAGFRAYFSNCASRSKKFVDTVQLTVLSTVCVIFTISNFIILSVLKIGLEMSSDQTELFSLSCNCVYVPGIWHLQVK